MFLDNQKPEMSQGAPGYARRLKKRPKRDGFGCMMVVNTLPLPVVVVLAVGPNVWGALAGLGVVALVFVYGRWSAPVETVEVDDA